MLRARVRLKLFSLSLRYKCFSLSLSLSLSLILCISRRTKESRVSLSCFFMFSLGNSERHPFLLYLEPPACCAQYLEPSVAGRWHWSPVVHIYINKHPREQRVGENDSGGEKNARARKSGKRFLYLRGENLVEKQTRGFVIKRARSIDRSTWNAQRRRRRRRRKITQNARVPFLVVA